MVIQFRAPVHKLNTMCIWGVKYDRVTAVGFNEVFQVCGVVMLRVTSPP